MWSAQSNNLLSRPLHQILKNGPVAISALVLSSSVLAETLQGSDLNSAASADSDLAAIYSANRGSNGGGDQSLQNGDVLQGTGSADLLQGNLGIDILFGGEGDDQLIGGPENGEPFNRDRIFGGPGDDNALWQPGDGNDYFDGGEGRDTLFVTVNPSDGLQAIVSDSNPCQIFERDNDFAADLEALDLNHLIVMDADDLFVNPELIPEGVELSSAIHLKNVEYLVCTRVDSGSDSSVQSIYRLSRVPAEVVDRSQLPIPAQNLAQSLTQ